MAESISVIDPDMGSGYDYDSLFDWEAAQQADIDTSNTIAVAKCRCTGGTADTTAVTIDGWTTSAADYIKIWTDPAESYRHNGTYQTGNKYRIVLSGAVTAIISNEQHCYFTGLQINLTDKTSDSSGFNIYVANCYVNECIISNAYRGITFYNGDTDAFKARNLLLLGCFRGIDNAGAGSTVQIYYNVTCIGTDAHGLLRAVFKNCVCIGYSTACFYAEQAGSTNNASSDTTADTGSGNLISLAAGDLDWVNSGAGDYHIQQTSVLVGAGINLYNDGTYPFQTDIDGQDRGGAAAAWDIGADEYVAAAVAFSAHVFLKQYKARRD